MSSESQLWRPSAKPSARLARADLYRDIRGFFAERNVLEVETPILSRGMNPDPNLESFAVPPRHFLRTSPEFALKRLLGDSPDQSIYELGKVFRVGESGRHHNPEFTMLEWYRPGMDDRQLATEVVELLERCLETSLETQPTRYSDVFQELLGLDVFDHDAVIACAKRNHGPPDLDVTEALDFLFATRIQPRLSTDGVTQVFDFPATQAALARIDELDPRFARRFEIFYGGHELANGYFELIDAGQLKERFHADLAERQRTEKPSGELDQLLMAAQQHGLPDCAGVALGVDRLLMLRTGATHMHDVINFPWERA